MGIGRYWCCIRAVSSVLGCIGAAQTRTSLRRLSGSAPSPPLISTLHPPLLQMGIGLYWCCIRAVSSVLGCIGAAQTRTSLRRLSGSAPSPPLLSTLHPPLRALQRPKRWMEGGDRGRRYTARQRIHHNTRAPIHRKAADTPQYARDTAQIHNARNTL